MEEVCYPTSHIPFYILMIVLISFIFFIIFWKNPQNHIDYNIIYQQPDTLIKSIPSDHPRASTVIIGSHYSSHSSATTSAPFSMPHL